MRMEAAEQNVDLFGTPLARFPCRLDALVGRSLVPRNGDDVVFTPDSLAAMIVEHFRPCGRVCEPCKGGGAFLRAMPGADWFEIAEGRDFLACEGLRWDWIVTNPPWSDVRVFMRKDAGCRQRGVPLSGERILDEGAATRHGRDGLRNGGDVHGADTAAAVAANRIRAWRDVDKTRVDRGTAYLLSAQRKS